MKPSLWSSYFIDLSPEEMVKAFSQKNWTAAELSDEHSIILLSRSEPAKAGREFKNYAEGYGFSFPQGHLWLHCDIASSRRQEEVDLLKKWLELYYAAGIKNAVLHPGGKEMIAAGCEPEKIMEIRVRSLKELSEFIKGTDLTICLENIVSTAPECEDLLEIINLVGASNIGICLDTGHLNICSGDQAGFIKKAGAYLKALHIADNEGTTDQHMMPFGRGSINWDEVVKALKETGYRGLFNLEIPGENRCPLGIRLAKLDYIKHAADYLINGSI